MTLVLPTVEAIDTLPEWSKGVDSSSTSASPKGVEVRIPHLSLSLPVRIRGVDRVAAQFNAHSPRLDAKAYRVRTGQKKHESVE